MMNLQKLFKRAKILIQRNRNHYVGIILINSHYTKTKIISDPVVSIISIVNV